MSNVEPLAPGAGEIAGVFNSLFAQRYRVEMIGGAVDPDYLPPTPTTAGCIRYRSDYAHSAMHEAAHWCIAGPQRRRQVDYGYWYQAPPRDEQAQQAFAEVEARVQALEAIFTEAAGLLFRVSIDDVDNLLRFEADFTRAVEAQRLRWWQRGLPARAELFRVGLETLASRRLACG